MTTNAEHNAEIVVCHQSGRCTRAPASRLSSSCSWHGGRGILLNAVVGLLAKQDFSSACQGTLVQSYVIAEDPSWSRHTASVSFMQPHMQPLCSPLAPLYSPTRSPYAAPMQPLCSSCAAPVQPLCSPYAAPVQPLCSPCVAPHAAHMQPHMQPLCSPCKHECAVRYRVARIMF